MKKTRSRKSSGTVPLIKTVKSICQAFRTHENARHSVIKKTLVLFRKSHSRENPVYLDNGHEHSWDVRCVSQRDLKNSKPPAKFSNH
jgi:hypothetical protein